jgi:hypothetical protein
MCGVEGLKVSETEDSVRTCVVHVRKLIFMEHYLLTNNGAHPASYPMDTRGSFPEGKAAAV